MLGFKRLRPGLMPIHGSRVRHPPVRLVSRSMTNVSDTHPSTARLSRFEPEHGIDYAEFLRTAELGRRL